MKDNPTIDNDLQKAIDDITKNTNEDPVFGDSVAAPEETAPMPPVPMPPAPKPAASFPEVGMPPAPKPPKAPTFRPAPAPRPAAAPMPPAPQAPQVAEATYEEVESTEYAPAQGELRDVREAVLRDLAPMVDKINIDPSKKFDIYKNIHEELHDDSVIASAYEVSREIADDDERDHADDLKKNKNQPEAVFQI